MTVVEINRNIKKSQRDYQNIIFLVIDIYINGKRKIE